jgi:acyl-CoA thioester hydrolase
MSRVSPIFQQRIVAHDQEIDELGHVSNVAFVRWIQDVAVAHSTSVGWDFDAYRRSGVVFVVRRHEVDYLRPVLAGQEIVLETWIESWTGASTIRCTRIARADGSAVATARTQWVLVAADSGRPRRIPPAIVDSFVRPDEQPAQDG